MLLQLQYVGFCGSDLNTFRGRNTMALNPIIPGHEVEVAFQTKLFVQKELDIRGSRNATPQDFRAVIRYLERGTCPTDQLITKVIAPDEAMDTMQWWDKHPGKVFRILVEWGR